MKVVVKFLGPLSREDKLFDVKNSDDLKDKLKKEIGSEWIESVAIAVNDKIVSDLNNIKDGDIISILPPVCGG
ncbi:MAG: molybdopterin synthase sulfur carrier subunit [Nautilia sp.]|nr:MAG: molybdopterin synthase sulfur carrier subunit [Nautilia sp.]